MEFFAYVRAKTGDDASDAEVCRQSGIRPETASRWKQNDGYEEWHEHRVAYYRTDIKRVLEQVALKNLDDFRYWETMAKKYGYIEPENEKPVMTAATPIPLEVYQAMIDAARAKIQKPFPNSIGSGPRDITVTNGATS
jgi:hypothetical protein